MSNILYVVGLGPGKREYMTGQAVSAILEAEIIAGYTAYTGVVKENFTAEELAGKEFFENLDAGDPMAAMVLDGYAEPFARYIYNLQSFLDVEKIAIGGGIAQNPKLIEAVK